MVKAGAIMNSKNENANTNNQQDTKNKPATSQTRRPGESPGDDPSAKPSVGGGGSGTPYAAKKQAQSGD